MTFLPSSYILLLHLNRFFTSLSDSQLRVIPNFHWVVVENSVADAKSHWLDDGMEFPEVVEVLQS